MKLITLEDVVESLRDMKNVVTVPEDIRLKAKAALDKMLAVPREW
jgi:quinolinate synthase